MSDEIDPVR